MSYNYTNGRSFVSPPGSLNGTDEPSAQAMSLAMRGALRVLPSSPRSPRDSDSDSWRGSRENFFASVMSLRDEQERVQKKTFTNWINSYLAQTNEDMKMDELFHDIKDGIRLLHLLETLSGTRLPKEQRRQMQRVHFLSNVRTALEFLESRHVKLVNINASDIVDGKPSIVLGLIWTVILYFQIEEQEEAIQAVIGNKQKEGLKGSGKSALLAWTGKQLTDKYGVPLKDFGPSWRDGHAFNALVHNIDPSLVDMDNLSERSNKGNLEQAFSAAEKHLGIPRLLDPEDVDVEKPDEKSVMTYVAQFLKAYPDGSPKKKPKLLEQLEEARQKVELARQAADREKRELESAKDFPSSVKSAMGAPNSPVQDGDFQRFQELKQRMQREMDTLNDLKRRGEAGQLLSLNPDDIPPVFEEVLAVEQDFQAWQWKLDCCLPGELGKVGKWLAEAEKCLYQAWPTGSDKAVHEQLAERLKTHKQLFRNMDDMRLKFVAFSKSNAFPNVPKEQLTDMEQRLSAVYKDEPNVYRRLDFTEHKFRIILYFILCEERLKSWTAPYGPRGAVQGLLEDYTKFVIYDELYDTVDQAFDEFKRKVVDQKKRELADDPAECQKLDRFVNTSLDKWEKLSRELQFAQPMLNEVLGHWRQFSQHFDALEDWIPEGDKALGMPGEDRKSFFSSLDSWEDRHGALNESGNFLIENSIEPVAEEIRQKLQKTNRMWGKLFDDAKEVERQEESERVRRNYRGGVKQVGDWLTKTETLLDLPLPFSAAAINEHLGLLLEAQEQLPSVEDTYKEASKLAQDLVQDSPQETVNEMYGSLKVMKDRLQKVRQELPEAIQRFQGVNSQVQSVEASVEELRSWIDDGEKLLESHRLEDNTDSAEERLQKHRAHFSESAYFKSMLDDLNAQLNNVGSDGPKNLRGKEMENKLRILKQRLQESSINGEHWDNKLDHFVRLWTLYDQAEGAMKDWLAEAQGVLDDGDSTPDMTALLRQHCAFFEASKSGPMRSVLPNLEQASRELEENFEGLSSIAERWRPLQQRFADAMSEGAKKECRLEFKVAADKLAQRFSAAEKELEDEERRIQAQDSLPEILSAHENYFELSDFHPTSKKALEGLQKTAQELQRLSVKDDSLKREHAALKRRYEELSERISRLHLKLQNLPQKWSDYKKNLNDLDNWANEMLSVAKQLDRTDLPPHVYQEAMERFDALADSAPDQQATAAALPALLEELLAGAPPEERKKFQQKLEAAQKAVKEATAASQKAEDKLPLLTQALAFKETADKRKEALVAKEEAVRRQDPLDDLESARAQLAEQEALMRALQEEGPALRSELARGKRLGGAPRFVDGAVDDLDQDWRQVSEAGQRRLQELQEATRQWEDFEANCGAVGEAVAAAEENLRRSQLAAGLEAVRSDARSKEELTQALENSKSAMEQAETLAKALKAKASPERRAAIDAQLSKLQQRFAVAEEGLQAKLSDLQQREKGWSEFYAEADALAAQLEAQEAQLAALEAPDVADSMSPAERDRRAAALAAELAESGDRAAELEARLQPLAAHAQRTKEGAAAKARAAGLKKAQEAAARRGAEQTLAAALRLRKFERCRELGEQVAAFLEAGEPPEGPCESLEEVEERMEQLEALRQKREALRPAMEELEELGDELADERELQKTNERLSKRWAAQGEAAERDAERMASVRAAWEDFEAGMADLEEEVTAVAAAKQQLTPKDNVEAQLAAARAAQEKMAAKEAALAQLQQNAASVSPAVSALIASRLAERQRGAQENIERVGKDVASSVADLTAALTFRKETTRQLDDFAAWLEKLSKRNARLDRVPESELPDALSRLRNLEAELKGREAACQELLGRKAAFCRQFSADASRAAHKRFEDLEIGFQQLQYELEAREELCDKWLPYAQGRDALVQRVEALQRALQASDFAEEEVPSAENELSGLRSDLQRWQKQAEDFEELQERARMAILGGRGREPLQMRAELEAALQRANGLQQELGCKAKQLEAISHEWQDIAQRRDAALAALAEVEATLQQGLSFRPSNAKGLNSLELQLEMAGQALHRAGKAVEELAARCKALADSEPGKALAAQECARSAEAARDRLRGLQAERSQHLQTLRALWTGQEELEAQVEDALEGARREMEAASGGDLHRGKEGLTQAKIARAADRLRSAEAELGARRAQLDLLQAKALQVAKAALKFRDFDQAEHQSAVRQAVEEWRHTERRLSDALRQVSEQQAMWEALDAAADEVRQWLREACDRLRGSADRLREPAAAAGRLEKFRRELPHWEKQQQEVSRRAAELQRTAGEVPQLQRQEEELRESFARAKDLAKRVADHLENFAAERQKLQEEVSDVGGRLSGLREAITACDDLSGSDEQLLERLGRAKRALEGLEELAPALEEMAERRDRLSANFDGAPELQGVAQQAAGLRARFDAQKEKAERGRAGLEDALRRRHAEAAKEGAALLREAAERLAWAQEGAGEGASLEARLGAVEELSGRLRDGEERTAATARRQEALRKAGVLPEEPEEEEPITEQLQRAVHSAREAKQQLVDATERLGDHDASREALQQWMKGAEAKLKKQVVPQGSFSAKEQLLKALKVMRKDLDQHRPDLEELETAAGALSAELRDPRQAEAAGAARDRFRRLEAGLDAALAQVEADTAEHAEFENRALAAHEWVAQANARLRAAAAVPGEEKEAAKAKLQALEKLLAESQEAGQTAVSGAVQAGEALLGQTSPEGRDTIRAELRKIRAAWAELCEEAGEEKSQLEAAVGQWSTYDESLGQFIAWVSDTEAAMEAEAAADPPTSLQAKRDLLQKARQRLQEVQGREPLLEAIVDKAQGLLSAEVQEELDLLRNHYETISEDARRRLAEWEAGVERHQHFQEASQALRDWLSGTEARVAACAEEAADKHGLQQRLDKLQAALPAMRGEGRARLEAARAAAAEMATGGGGNGGGNGGREAEEVAAAEHRLEALCARAETLAGRHEERLAELHGLEEKAEELTAWVKSQEPPLREGVLKATAEEKAERLEELEEVQAQVRGKEPEFAALRAQLEPLAALDSRLHSRGQALWRRFEELRRKAEEEAVNWRRFAAEHAAFDAKAAACSRRWAALEPGLAELQEAPPDSRAALERRKEEAAQLGPQVEGFAAALNEAVTAAERVYSATSVTGRDDIRADLKRHREQYEAAVEALALAEKGAEEGLLALRGTAAAADGLERWMAGVERTLEQLHESGGSISAKRERLQGLRALHQDISSHTHAFESLADKGKSVTDPELANQAADVARRFATLQAGARQQLQEHEKALQEHRSLAADEEELRQWLQVMEERLALHSSVEGDPLALEAKLAKLNEIAAQLPDGNERLQAVSAQANRVARGREEEEAAESLEGRLHGLRTATVGAIRTLDDAIRRCEAYAGAQADMARWLRQLESQLRAGADAASSAEEKRRQAVAVEDLAAQVAERGPGFDAFLREAAAVAALTGDARSNTEAALLQQRRAQLETAARERLTRCEKAAELHADFDEKHGAFRDAVAAAERRLQQLSAERCGESEAAAERLRALQGTREELAAAALLLQEAEALSERLFGDTSGPGREKLRAELGRARDRLEEAERAAEEEAARCQDYLDHRSSFEEKRQSALAWLEDIEDRLEFAADRSVPWMAAERRTRAAELRAIAQEVATNARPVDRALERAYALRQAGDESEAVLEFVAEVPARFGAVKARSKAMVQKAEQQAADSQKFQESLAESEEWISSARTRLQEKAAPHGDRGALRAKLAALEELAAAKEEGERRVADCTAAAEKVAAVCGAGEKEEVGGMVNGVESELDGYAGELEAARATLQEAVEKLDQHDEAKDELQQWLKAKERQAKEKQLGGSAEEKKDQLKKVKTLLAELEKNAGKVQEFVDSARDLSEATLNGQMSDQADSVEQRYASLKAAAEEAAKKCEESVGAHEDYLTASEKLKSFLAALREDCDDVESRGGGKQELKEKHSLVESLLNQKNDALALYNEASEAWESMAKSSSPEGREKTRRELRASKAELDNIFEGLGDAKRQTDNQLQQVSNLEEIIAATDAKLERSAAQFKVELVLQDGLEEKKAQLQEYRSLMQEVAAQSRAVGSLSEKSRALGGADGAIEAKVEKVRAEHAHTLEQAKEAAALYEGYVRDHAQFQTAYNDTLDWIAGLGERLGACSDLKGDKHALKNRLDQLKDLSSLRSDGEPRIQEVEALSERVIPNTAAKGQGVLRQEVTELRQEWDDLLDSLAQTRHGLEQRLADWGGFDAAAARCQDALKEAESGLRGVELRAALAEKRAQVDRLAALAKALEARDGDFAEAARRGEALAEASGERHAAKAGAQLGAKQEAVQLQAADLTRRWRAMVADHEAFEERREAAEEWLSRFEERLQEASVGAPAGRAEAAGLLAQVEALQGERETGFRVLQELQEAVQPALATTSAQGREQMRREVADLQRVWDGCLAAMGAAKSRLDAGHAQWSLYEEGSGELQEWLQDVQRRLREEREPAGGLPELQSRLERLQTQRLQLQGKQPVARRLEGCVKALASGQAGREAAERVASLVEQFDAVQADTAALLQDTEAQLKEQQRCVELRADLQEQQQRLQEQLRAVQQPGDRQALAGKKQQLQDVTTALGQLRPRTERLEQLGKTLAQRCAPEEAARLRQSAAEAQEAQAALEKELQERQAGLEALQGRWRRFDAEQEAVAEALREAEVALRAQNEQRATLPEKQQQLAAVRRLQEEVQAQQEAIERLNAQGEELQQDCPDLKVATKLSQLNARFGALCGLAKEMHEKAQRMVSEHTEFDDAFAKASECVVEAQRGLSQLKTPSSDRYGVQAQLERLSDFAVVREEGQILLQSAGSWADKAMLNTSPGGREAVRRAMGQLSSNWTAFLNELGETRSGLDTALMQWTEFDDSLDQVRRWEDEMRAKVAEASGGGGDSSGEEELSEKALRLQRAKALQSEIGAYQAVLESVARKMEDLNSEGGARGSTEVARRTYAQLKAEVEGVVGRQEALVAQHQAFSQAALAFQQWLRTQRARLVNCSDCFGERAAVEAKLQRAQALAAELPQGEELARRAAALGEEVGGGSRQEAAAVKADFAAFAGEVEAATKSLGRCRQLWDLFESSRTAFAEDIGVLEEQLRRRPALRTTPQEKRQQLAQCQRQHEELLGKQADLDTLQSRVQDLLAINPDSRLSQGATQLATRYQNLVALSNEQLTRQEAVLNDHVAFQAACDAFSGWAAGTREELLQLDRRAKARAEVEQAQPRLAALQQRVETGAEQLKVAEELGERTAGSTDPGGCAALRDTMDELRRNFTEIRDQVGRLRLAFDSAAAGLSEFDRSAEQLEAWMRDSEGRLTNGAPEAAEDLPAKKAALERLRVLASEVASKKAAVDRLGHRARDLEDPLLSEQAEEVVRKHARLLASAKENVAKLEETVSGQEEYRAATEQARDWLASARQRLQRLRDPQGTQRELEARLEGFRPLKVDLAKEGQALVERVDQFANQMLNANPPNREEVLREVDSIHNDLAVLTTETEQVEGQQAALIEKWHEFVEQCQQFNDWLREVDSNLKRHVEYGPDFESKQRQAKEYELILEDIYGHKPDLERLRESANSLLQLTQDTSGQSKVLQYTSRYQSLQTTCQTLLNDTHQRLEGLAKEHRFYEESMEDAVAWIESTTQRLLQCSDIAGDQAALRDKITVVKEIARSLDDGQMRLNTAVDAADKVLKKTPREGAEKVRKQTEELRHNWHEVNAQLASVSGALSTVAAKWNDYEELHQRLDRWLQDTERTVEALSVPKSDLVERKARLEKFQNLQRDLDKYEPEVEELQRVCDELQAGGPQPAVEEQSTALTSRFCVLKGRVIERLQVLDQAQREYMRYLEALQKCEKWIVQASFKVMTQSASPCSTLEATQTQMERHSSTAREIAEQRKEVDQVVAYGRKVMEDSSHNGDVVEEIQGELGKLEDEYKNLQEKSDQLGERLKENMGKWRAYKEQIQGAEKFLRGELSSWWMDKEHPEAESLADVGKQSEDTRRMMERLHRLRSDIGAAAHRCEAVTLGSSRPPSRNTASRSRPRTPLLSGPTSGFESPLLSPSSPDPVPSDSPFSRQAEKVNRELKENVEKMERRLDALGGERTKWEDADHTKEDFRAWLREKQQELREVAPSGRSAGKMEPEQAERELQRLQAFMDELHRNGDDLRTLEESYSNLTQHKPGQPDAGLRAARDDYEDLLGQASNQVAQRRDFLEQYGRDQEMEELIKKVQAQQVAHARGDNSKSTQTLRHHGTQTPSANSAYDAQDGAGSDWLVGSAQGRSPNPEDPIESLRRTLRELDGSGPGSPSSRRPSRRSQTEAGLEQKLTQTVADEGTQTKRSRKPTRQAALRSLLNSVRSIKEELARSEDAKLPAIPPLPTQDLPPAPEPLSLRSPFSPMRAHSPARLRSPEMESVRRNGPVLVPRSPDLPLPPTSPGLERRPLPVGRSPPPPAARSVSFSPPVRGSPSGRTLSPEPPLLSEKPRGGLSPDAFRDYIPTKPHWRGEAPLPISNGYDALSNGSSRMTPRSASPARPMQMTEMVRDYNAMLRDSGNVKRPRSSRPSSRSSRR